MKISSDYLKELYPWMIDYLKNNNITEVYDYGRDDPQSIGNYTNRVFRGEPSFIVTVVGNIEYVTFPDLESGLVTLKNIYPTIVKYPTSKKKTR